VLTSGENDDEGPLLEVYSLPSLGLLMQTPISTLTGETWQAPPAGKASKLIASTRLGHLALLSPLVSLGVGNEEFVASSTSSVQVKKI
jgi:hypothetical protein